jgi:hypothetical protein
MDQNKRLYCEQHCLGCHFLGNYNNHDLYVCFAYNPTVIARYGSGGGDYRSGLIFVGDDDELTEAARRACMDGLLDLRMKTGRTDGLDIGQGISKFGIPTKQG